MLASLVLLYSCCTIAGAAIITRASEEDVTYVFYSRSVFDGIEVTIKEVDDVEHIKTVFDPEHPTIVLIHGWKDGYAANSNTYIRSAILSHLDANVIKVDWSKLAGKIYLVAKNAVPSVGKYAAHFLQELTEEFDYSLKNVTLVGFSLGAHVAGNIGKTLKGEFPLIIGLDPAGPLISSKNKAYSLCTDDADYVEIIHSDAGSAGMKDAIGHSDFYPNGGKNQPGCSGVGCSHNRAWEYYAESITDNKFVAQNCNSYRDFTKKRCEGSYAYMGGFTVDKTVSGVYYLDTNSEAPYGQG